MSTQCQQNPSNYHQMRSKRFLSLTSEFLRGVVEVTCVRLYHTAIIHKPADSHYYIESHKKFAAEISWKYTLYYFLNAFVVRVALCAVTTLYCKCKKRAQLLALAALVLVFSLLVTVASTWLCWMQLGLALVDYAKSPWCSLQAPSNLIHSKVLQNLLKGIALICDENVTDTVELIGIKMAAWHSDVSGVLFWYCEYWLTGLD